MVSREEQKVEGMGQPVSQYQSRAYEDFFNKKKKEIKLFFGQTLKYADVSVMERGAMFAYNEPPAHFKGMIKQVFEVKYLMNLSNATVQGWRWLKSDQMLSLQSE